MARWTPAPLVGGAYKDDTRPFSVQDTVNWIPERAEAPGGRSEWMLRDAPGAHVHCDLGSNSPIRGLHDVEGLLLAVSGNTLYTLAIDGVATSRGTIPGTSRVQIAHNQVTGGNEVLIANGQSGYVYNTVTETLAQITDDAYPGAITVDYLAQVLAQIEPQRRYWFHSDVTQATQYLSTDQYEAEAAPDLLVTLIATHGQLLALGDRTGEFYEATGGTTSFFERMQGTTLEVGCASAHAAVRLDATVFWVGSDGCGYRLNGYNAQRITTHAIEQAWARCDLKRCFAFTFEDRGHKIVYFTFPDGGTWGYDVATQEWHRRQSQGLGRWRMNALVLSNGQWIAGDYSNGKLYRLDWEHRLECCEPLERDRISGVLHDNQNRVGVNAVELVFATGGAESLPHDPPTITGSLPDGSVGDVVSYQYVITKAYPGQGVIALTGALPTGLSMDSDGLVTGTITEAGTFNWSIALSGGCDPVTLADSATIAAVIFPATRKGWASLPSSGQFGVMDIAGSNAKAIGNAAAGITIATMFDTAVNNGAPGLYLSTGTSASAYRATMSCASGDDKLRAIGQRLDADSPVTLVSPATYPSQWVMMLVTFDYVTGAMRMHINGALVATGAMTAGLTSSATDSLGVGMHPGTSYRVRGADTSVYRGVLNQTQIDKLFGYMAENWNLRSKLPADHPYKSASVNGFNPKAAGARIWYYADNAANTFPDATHISTLVDASGHSNDAVRLSNATNNLDYNTPFTPFG